LEWFVLQQYQLEHGTKIISKLRPFSLSLDTEPLSCYSLSHRRALSFYTLKRLFKIVIPKINKINQEATAAYLACKPPLICVSVPHAFDQTFSGLPQVPAT
jgi:hypothetical protein